MPNWCLIEVQMVKNPQCVLNTMYFLPKGWTLVWEHNLDSMYWGYKIPVSSYKKKSSCAFIWYVSIESSTWNPPRATILNGTHSAKDLCGYLWKSFLRLKYTMDFKYTKICLLRVLCLPISPALWMVVCLVDGCLPCGWLSALWMVVCLVDGHLLYMLGGIPCNYLLSKQCTTVSWYILMCCLCNVQNGH